MSRRKVVNFVDAADIYLDTSSPAAVRDLAVMVATYARVRKLPFKVTVTDVAEADLIKEAAMQYKPKGEGDGTGKDKA